MLQLSSAVALLIFSLGHCRVNPKVRKEYHWASKAHANNSSNQVARTAVDLIDLEVVFGVADATLG